MGIIPRTMQDKIITDLMSLKNAKESLEEAIDLIINSNNYSIPKKKGEDAKKYVKIALQVIKHEGHNSRKWKEKDKIDIFNLIDEMRHDPSKKLSFRHIDGDLGVEEEFSGKKFYYIQ